jgi:hypothetical protein
MRNHYEILNHENNDAIDRIYQADTQLLHDIEDMQHNGKRRMSDSDIERAAIIRDIREICRG